MWDGWEYHGCLQDVLSSSNEFQGSLLALLEKHDFSFVFGDLARSFIESVGNSLAPLKRLGNSSDPDPRFGALSRETSISAIDKSTYYCIAPERISPKH